MNRELKKGAVFLAKIIVIGTLIYAIINAVLVGAISRLVAAMASMLLSVMGIANTVAAVSGLATIYITDSFQAQIIGLCTGDIELAVLLAAILATEDRDLGKRAWGAFYAIFFVFIINSVRIALSLAAGVWFGIAIMDIVHNVLFRLVLLVAIVGYYTVWYMVPVARKRKR